MKNFSPDRLVKYGWGILRLAPIVLFAFRNDLDDYINSKRWISHVYIGSVGSFVNVSGKSYINIPLLLGAAILLVQDIMYIDYSLLIYLTKTMSGDFFAGKLDTVEWKIVLLFTFGILVPLSFIYEIDSISMFSKYSQIFTLLFVIQLICEYGDNYWEKFVFFRHRYSFELLTLMVLFLPNLQQYELSVVQFDLVICFFYRFSNVIIYLFATGYFSSVLKKSMFQFYGLYQGYNMQNVTDPEVAMLVLKASTIKGLALESKLALPAWYPIYSLESVDGELWKSMRKEFDALLKIIPNVIKLQDITKRKVTELIALDRIVGAEEIARLTVASFIEYLFDREWSDEFEVFVLASWEWRKEIALRGKGDVGIKSKAVRVLLDNLMRRSDLFWNLFGEKWNQPEYFSLILQPFIISPAINVGDIMVSVKMNPQLTLEEAMRDMHPFPIFERFVEKDIIMKGRVVVKANTQVIMFTNDFKSSAYVWPVFGAGARSCAGQHIAYPFLKVLLSSLAPSSLFHPEKDHRFSGRNNDDKNTWNEIYYFLTTVLRVILSRQPPPPLPKYFKP